MIEIIGTLYEMEGASKVFIVHNENAIRNPSPIWKILNEALAEFNIFKILTEALAEVNISKMARHTNLKVNANNIVRAFRRVQYCWHSL